MRSKLIIITFAILLLMPLFSGCEPEPVRKMQLCPGKSNASQALAALEANGRVMGKIKVIGKCKSRTYEPDKKEPRNEQFPMKIWVDPPKKLVFHGDILFQSRGLDIGSNYSEYWIAARPNELGNVYIWGRWDQLDESADIMLDPKFFLQAFGQISMDKNTKWSLAKKRGSDMLIETEASGAILRKIYVDNCTYRPKTIEYLDAKSRVFAQIELSDYINVAGAGEIPSVIEIKRRNSDGTYDSFEVTVDSANQLGAVNPAMFDRPRTKGFKDVYQMIDGKAVQQK